MRFKIIQLKAVFLLLLVVVSSNCYTQVFSTDFELLPHGTAYVRSVWEADGFNPNNWDNALASRSMIDSSMSVSGDKSLQITYPAGNFGNSLATGTGVQVELLLTPKVEYFMSYNLCFSDNFSWGTTSEGGKLPGITGRMRCGSDFICDGTDGFSARFMWRRNGRAVLYLYHADMPNAYGQDFTLHYPNGDTVFFEKGKWYTISERVQINTDADTKNGDVQVWINGVEVLNLDTLRFQTNGDLADCFYFSTFHGGNDATWAPTETCYMWYDDLLIDTLVHQYISLEEGWNVVSCNIVPVDASIESIFPNATQVKTADGFWKSSVPNYLNSIQTVEAGKGYLVYNTKKDKISIAGSMDTTNTTQLQAGWNLIGVPIQKSLSVFNLPEETEIIKNFDAYFEPAWNGLLEELLPSNGYFIKVNSDCEIIWK